MTGDDLHPRDTGLKRKLGVRDLTAFGVAAVIGAGVFSTIGKAAVDGGPGVALLYIFTAIACGFSALCYAEFASRIPIAGSAYTYAYATFGELIAWIIGWDLLLEYAIGNVVVAISWSDYFTSLLNQVLGQWNLRFPDWLAMDYFSAARCYTQSLIQAPEAGSITAQGLMAWNNAPRIGNFVLIFDLPAVFITAVITYIVFRGISGSRNTSNLLVAIKLAVIFLVIVVGAFYVDTDNWNPFLPHGIGGVLKGVSAVFFAYIGFDAISTTAEECKNPRRDLPRGIIFSLIICTLLYVAISFVMTGMVDSQKFAGVGDPLLFIFEIADVTWMRWIIGVSAVVALSSVLLVFQLGQPRIWMSMSRDGLLPPRFSRLHPRFGTPSFATILTGIVVALPLFFFNIDELTDFTSLGTLFAFVIVCGGVVRLHMDRNDKTALFRVPYISGAFILPAMLLGVAIYISFFAPQAFLAYISPAHDTNIEALSYIHRLPRYAFLLLALGICLGAIKYRFSLLPSFGMLCCFYMMTEVPYHAWERFLIWLVIGLAVYFAYSRRHSMLSANKAI